MSEGTWTGVPNVEEGEDIMTEVRRKIFVSGMVYRWQGGERERFWGVRGDSQALTAVANDDRFITKSFLTPLV